VGRVITFTCSCWSAGNAIGQSRARSQGQFVPWLNEISNGFGWQQGYGAFNVSESRRHAVIDYIGGQEEHHRKRSFEQEFLTLLRNSKIEFDPKYIFA
jgi:hypothetical protein